MDNFIGEIKAFPYTFVPMDWLPCNGQSLPVSQYQPLYAVIGVMYGGTPNVNFNLPNLIGVVPVGATGSTGNFAVGQKGGTETASLNASQLPVHNHNIQAKHVNQNLNLANLTPNPFATAFLTNAATVAGSPQAAASVSTYAASTSAGVLTLHPSTLGVTGGPAPVHENRMPFLPMQWAICVNGTFPVRQ